MVERMEAHRIKEERNEEERMRAERMKDLKVKECLVILTRKISSFFPIAIGILI
jgi:hypothetical protein